METPSDIQHLKQSESVADCLHQPQEHVDIMLPADPRSGIIYDDAYRKTLTRDLARQKVRRAVHNLQSAYERAFWWPRWKAVKSTPLNISTCIMTMNSAHRIGPLLEYIRSFSDEIVVGVDSKTTDNTWDVCKNYADELFIIENDALTCNGGLEALVNRCHGDWVLRLDDDEFPEPIFAELLPSLIATERYTHYKLPRLHLASADMTTHRLTWINDSYLYPDFQMRLFKNDKALLKFPEAVGHASIECAGLRGRINTVNLVHLNMAINPRDRREEKLRKYIRRLDGAWVHPVNEYALLFEDFDYRIETYDYPDPAFRQRLIETVETQQYAFEHDMKQKTV